jgi:hypothetical protein
MTMQQCQLAIVDYEDQGRHGDLLLSRWVFSDGAELVVEFKMPRRVPKFSRLMKARLRQDEEALRAYGFPKGCIDAFLHARETVTAGIVKEQFEAEGLKLVKGGKDA